MGKVLKQSFWTTIIIYFGILLGFINSLILFPNYLSTEQIGLIRQIISASSILIPLTTFGVSATYLKFYPNFKNDNRLKNEFLSIQFFFIIISFVIICSLLILFSNNIKYLFTEKSQIFFNYYHIVFSILLIMTLSTLFEAYLRARYDIILTNFSNGVLNRFLTSISVILLSFSIITFEKLLLFQAPIYLLGLLLIFFYSYKKENFSILLRLNKIKKYVNEITNYSIFSIFNSFGNILVSNVDILMVTALLGLSETGIYTTAFYIGLMIAIPRRAIAQISIPIISENIKENNFNKIEKNYKLVSLHLLLIGVFIYLLIIINLNDIYYLIPNSQNFISGKNVVYIIGLAKLVTMAFSFNGELIMMSKYFKFNVITILILATLSIILNYLLIPNFGMIGAAYASLISILIFNLIKLIFIKIKMKILPFSNKTIIVIFMGLLTYFLSIYIPNLENSLINILLKSSLISIFYIILIYKSKISPEFNTILNRIISPQKS